MNAEKKEQIIKLINNLVENVNNQLLFLEAAIATAKDILPGCDREIENLSLLVHETLGPYLYYKGGEK